MLQFPFSRIYVTLIWSYLLPTREVLLGVTLVAWFWFGSNLPMGQEGGELQWSLHCEAWSVLSCTPSRWAPSLRSLNP